MFFGKKPVFIGLHFAKTGGTSIRAHIAGNLNKNAFCPYGAFANANSFFNGRPLLPEFSGRRKAGIRFVYGHGVDADVLHHFADREVALFVVCRDPYRRFLSSLKHAVRTRGEFGESVDPRAVFESQPENPFAQTVLRQFGALAPDDVTDPKERLIAVLRCFRFIMSTDDLNAQSAPFFSALGLPPLREARRVYREEAQPADVTEAEIRARDDLDAFVNEATNRFHESGGTSAEHANPFGFDAAALRERLDALKAAAPTPEADIEKTYDDLFSFLDRNGRLEAARIFLEAGGHSRHVTRLFEAWCRREGRTFAATPNSSRTLCHQAEVWLRLRRPGRAGDYARRAIEADPNNPMAYHLAGRAALNERRYADAAADLERAVALNPLHAKSFRFLATAYEHLDRKAEADTARKAAKAL